MLEEAEFARKRAEKIEEVQKARERLAKVKEDLEKHPDELTGIRTQAVEDAARNLENRQFELDHMQ